MDYEYDIAISYKSEIEAKAARINDYLVKDGWNVFFAPEKQQELLSEKILEILSGRRVDVAGKAGVFGEHEGGSKKTVDCKLYRPDYFAGRSAGIAVSGRARVAGG